ncbi:MAG: Gfo/Idh/MocA family oxidoreductase [Myxococcota bacterium]|jgi:predicted dehydrogenase|nr:oxidoreductase [Deltaproteobacteria bacterium]MCP4244264.1 Gfo/Idh/MocA family oxidoreductase [bacterium]MDP6244503.1 Gfo/Idh/MocA family oxidoreductase [Myxococcota bacterium]MDP7074281.1 Gfo/Idh/MocA family oxidoreductase [Myxococcota bacterium]MDP7300825.1 Gfo/Idh/MocA family oxidoreductase [Myxococcota bacterium]
MNDLRYGVIGAGMMGLEHMRNLRLLEGVRVTAVADPHAASRAWASLAAQEAGDPISLYAQPREMLAREALDAVIVSTPNATHASILQPILETDLHVLVEKPLCTTLDDARRTVEAADRHGGVFWVGMEYRYMPPVARLLEELRAGAVGRLRMLAIREHRMPFLPKVGDWNRFAIQTGGTLVEKCCHFFDLMRLLTNEEPVRIYASAGQDVNHLDECYDGRVPDILDNAFTIVDFDGGARALLDLCMFAEGSRNREEIAATGDAGKLECFIPDSTLVIGKRNPRSIESRPIPVEQRILEAGFHHGSTYYQHVRFQRAIREGGAAEVSAHDGMLAVAMGVAAERSAATGHPVEMRELGF